MEETLQRHRLTLRSLRQANQSRQNDLKNDLDSEIDWIIDQINRERQKLHNQIDLIGRESDAKLWQTERLITKQLAENHLGGPNTTETDSKEQSSAQMALEVIERQMKKCREVDPFARYAHFQGTIRENARKDLLQIFGLQTRLSAPQNGNGIKTPSPMASPVMIGGNGGLAMPGLMTRQITDTETHSDALESSRAMESRVVTEINSADDMSSLAGIGFPMPLPGSMTRQKTDVSDKGDENTIEIGLPDDAVSMGMGMQEMGKDSASPGLDGLGLESIGMPSFPVGMTRQKTDVSDPGDMDSKDIERKPDKDDLIDDDFSGAALTVGLAGLGMPQMISRQITDAEKD